MIYCRKPFIFGCLMLLIIPCTHPHAAPALTQMLGKMRPNSLSALSLMNAKTKGGATIALDSASFQSGAQLNLTNASSVQGASGQQLGAAAGTTNVSTTALTGVNLLTSAKLLTGDTGNLIGKTKRSAALVNNTSTNNTLSTNITGTTGAFGNSTINQSGATIGSNIGIGMVSGPSTTINLTGNLLNPYS